jgi:hypothetical protein
VTDLAIFTTVLLIARHIGVSWLEILLTIGGALFLSFTLMVCVALVKGKA